MGFALFHDNRRNGGIQVDTPFDRPVWTAVGFWKVSLNPRPCANLDLDL
jgi:hypothetical protein